MKFLNNKKWLLAVLVILTCSTVAAVTISLDSAASFPVDI